MAPAVELVLDARAGCAECPVWALEEGALYWTDIPGRTLNRFDPATGDNRSWHMPEEVGSFALRAGGGIVAAMRHGFAFVDLDAAVRIERLGDPEDDRPENRFNDGRCDRRGRFWAGTMHEPRTRKDGALYCLDPVGSWRRMADGVIVANGLAWSPDDRVMYWSDSRSGVVYRFDSDPETGEVANRRVFAQTTDADEVGRPDGAAVDAEGGYWSARFLGGRVMRYAPDGSVDRTIRLPVRRVTMCAFGGPDLSTLYVTTARAGMSAAELEAEPLAGGIFAARDVGVRGLAEPRFAG